MSHLERALPARSQTRMRLAEVTAVQAASGTVTIDLAGTSIADVPFLIEPAANDAVFVFQDGAAILCLGPSQIP